jgi:hypothetical protein
MKEALMPESVHLFYCGSGFKKAALADLENTGYHLMYVKGPDASAGTDERSA